MSLWSRLRRLRVHPDDQVEIKGKQLMAALDNVVLEYGMFLGKLGRDREIALFPATATSAYHLTSPGSSRLLRPRR